MEEIEEISKEIQNILAKHNITIDLIETVLSQSCNLIKLIKLRTEIKAIDTPQEILNNTISKSLEGGKKVE